MGLSTRFLLALTASLSTLAATAYGQDSLTGNIRTTLPVVFTKTTSAESARSGDVVLVKTTQQAQLANGMHIPSGTRILGRVIFSSGYLQRHNMSSALVPDSSVLTIRFDSIVLGQETLPIIVYVRAMADPFESESALVPRASDLDSLSTTTQIGGDLVTPYLKEVLDQEGRVVGTNRRSGVYERLRQNGGCSPSTEEVSVGLYSGGLGAVN